MSSSDSDPRNLGRGFRGHLHQPLALRPLAHDAKRQAGKPAGLDRQVDPFVGHERRHNQQERFRHGRIRAVEPRVDRGVDDRRVPIIVPTDPAGNVLRDSHIPVYPAGRGGIPAGQRPEHGPQQPVGHRSHAPGAEIRVELVPRVTHRREAVAEVARPPGLHDRLRRAMAGADDQVVAVEVELLDRHGEERQAVAVEASNARQALEERRPRPKTFDGGRHAAGHVHQRQQIGGRVHPAEHFEDLLAASHARQPIVHQHDARGAHCGPRPPAVAAVAVDVTDALHRAFPRIFFHARTPRCRSSARRCALCSTLRMPSAIASAL